jgi:hypothetical protein
MVPSDLRENPSPGFPGLGEQSIHMDVPECLTFAVDFIEELTTRIG